MSNTGRPAARETAAVTRSAAGLGERPADDTSTGCAGCGHPYALHRNGTSACHAYACTAGPGGGPCQGFTPAAAAA